MQSIQTATPLTSDYGLTELRVRMRKTFFRLILIVLGIGVGLVISEIIMRAFKLGHTRSVILYNDKIFKLPPHASFMNLDENTILMETNNLGVHDREGNILATRKQPGVVKSTINYVRDHSVLMDRLYETAYRMKKNVQEGSGGGAGDDGGRVDRSGAWRASEQGTIALIKRWRSELSAKKIPFDVVVIDRPGKVYNKFELEFADRLLTTCAAEGIDCLRLKLTDDPFESYSFDRANLGHFNYKGHELSANELYDYFKSHHAAIFNRTSEEHKSN